MSKLKLYVSVLLLGLMTCNAEAASYKNTQQTIQLKPHAPVYMTYNLPGNVKVNKELTVRLSFKNKIDVDDLIIHFHTDNNLKLVSEKQSSFGIQTSSQLNTMNVIVVPQNKGLFYINVSATLVNNGKHQSRSFAIPVYVGEQNQAKALPKKPSFGSGIISMPAIE